MCFLPLNDSTHFTRCIIFFGDTWNPLLIGHVFLYSLDKAGTGRRSLEFHGIGHMDTVETGTF